MELRGRLQSTLGSAYTLGRELGGGGMSRVFVADETALGRKVVVKVLPQEMAGVVSTERFKREITLAARLQHAHIVPLLSAGDSDGLPFFTMPLIDGESLRSKLAREGELPVGEAMKILRDVASALAYAHAQGVVHRDIKPENILLTAHDALVTDFGVAKALSASATHADAGALTSIGIALGTPAYMAPEQAAADPITDYRADLYALGVVGYEMLAGHAPFAGRSAGQTLAAHASEAAPPLDRARPSVPAPLTALVMRCLEKRPADRPKSADEFLHAIDALVNQSGGSQPQSGFRAASVHGRSWTRHGTRVAVAALVVVLGTTAIAKWLGRPSATIAAKSIAVLPFANLSGAKENEFFSEGVTEEITDALGKVPGLRVAARTSAAAAMAKGLDLRHVGQELSVGSVLQGSIQRVGDRVRISAQLVDVANGFQVWSGKYDNELKDIFQVQDTIAKAIVSALRIKLAGGAATTIVRVATGSPEAHTLYLQGLYLWNRRTAQTVRQAISFFKQAIEKDPRYAQAYAGVAMGYAVLPIFADVLAADTLAKAKEAANRAIALDSTLADAYAAMGYVELSFWRNASAERAFRRAIELDSTFATAHQWYAIQLAHLGRYDEAVSEIRRAHDLDPQSRVIGVLVGQLLYGARRNAEAESTLRKVMEFDPSFPLSYRNLSLVFIAQGKFDDAVTAAQRSLELFGDRSSFDVALLAQAYALGGHTAEARVLLQELVARSARERVSGTGMALLYDALGDHEHALQWLGRAFAEYDWPLNVFSHSPLLDHLRADPHGAALFAKIEAMNDSS